MRSLRSSQFLCVRSATVWTVLTAVVLTTGLGAFAASDSDAFVDARNSISAAELQQYVTTLADDAYEGREAGSRGGRRAGQYLAEELERMGIRGAAGDGGYFQPFGHGCRNVLAERRGSDEKLKHEYIVIGAHYDHVGYGRRSNSRGPIGYVHNGADDNASGVAGVLETAEAFAQLPIAPRRSVVFAFWDGEEKGLLGSEHFVNDSPIPLQRIELVLNADMIGRMQGDRLVVFGTRTAPGLRRRVAENNNRAPLELDFDWELVPNSDHYPFFRRRVPVLLFHTGVHDDMHSPRDDADRINPDGMERAAGLLFQVAYALAQAEGEYAFREASRRELPADRERLERPLPPTAPRLGVRWTASREAAGVVLTSVQPGSAADLAGLKPGDRFLDLDGWPVEDGEQLQRELLAARSPAVVRLRRSDDASPLTVKVELEGPPSRLGISWREDSAEPGTVILTRVLEGSPADRAQLRPGDRVYAVARQSFADSAALMQLVTTLPGPLELTIERQGRLRTVTLDLPEKHPLAEL